MNENHDQGTDSIKLLSEIKADLANRDRQFTEIDSRFRNLDADLKGEIRNYLEANVKEHRKHIISLYSKFERIIYVLVFLGVGVAAYLGIEVNSIPKLIENAGETYKREIKSTLDAALEESKRNVKIRFDEVISDIETRSKNSRQVLSDSDDSANNALKKIEELENEAGRLLSSAAQRFNQINQLAKTAGSLQDGTSKIFNNVLSRISNQTKVNSVEISTLWYKSNPPRSRDDLSNLVQAILLSATLPDTRPLGRLLGVIGTIPDNNLLVDNKALNGAIDKLVSDREIGTLPHSLIRAGLLVENENVIRHVRSVLKKSPADGEWRDKVIHTLDAIIAQKRTGRFGWPRFVRASTVRPRSITLRFVAELVRLADFVEFPLVASKAMNLINFGELSTNQRSEFNFTLLRWAKSKKLHSILTRNVLRKMPFDQFTGRFYSFLFRPNFSTILGVKREAGAFVVEKLRYARSVENSIFFANFRKEKMIPHLNKEQKLALRYSDLKFTEESIYLPSSRVLSRDRSYFGVDESIEIKINESTITIEELRAGSKQIGFLEKSVLLSANLDGKPLRMENGPIDFQLTPKRSFLKLNTNLGKKVIMRHNYVTSDQLVLGFAIGPD